MAADRAQASWHLWRRPGGPVVARTALKGTAFPPGSLVKARGRDWVVLPDAAPGLLVARPLNGDPELVTGLFADEVQEATFPKPATGPGEIGDNLAAGLLRTALQVGFTSSAGSRRVGSGR